MVLNFKEMGDPTAPPIIALHGLLGSMRNWTSAGRLLAEKYRVFLVDARNHGSSFHAPTHSFDDMVQDLVELLDHLGLESASFIGHSMGGRVAMTFACRYPAKVNQLFIVDTAPKDYPPLHDEEFEAMNALNLSKLKSRADIDVEMSEYIEDWAFRQFLISNVVRAEDSEGFKWLINLPVIEAHLDELSYNPLDSDEIFDGKTHFLVGGKSHFVDRDDFKEIRHHFPHATIDTWNDSGHNPHFDHKERFVKWVMEK
jgi:esterase